MDLEQMRLDDELEMKRILESKQEEIDDFIEVLGRITTHQN